MTLQFTLSEMISALERIGYTIKEEQEIEHINHPGFTEERPYKVYNCYYRGNLMTDIGFERLGGVQRIERVFRYEVQKKILRLFE